MNKITENANKRQTLSAQDQYDEGEICGYSPEDMDEAALIEREIQDIPNKKEWEPTEEKFQALLSKAKERGFITEKDEGKTIPKTKSNRKHKFQKVRKRVIKWSAVAAITAMGIFVTAMSSEANRAYLMSKVNTMLNSEVKTKANNVEVLESNAGENVAREEIETAFGMKMPTFFYMPEEMKYESHMLAEDAGMAMIQYTYNETVVYFTVVSNSKEAANTMQSDRGNEIEKISSDLIDGLQISLYEIKEEEDKNATYMLQWQYKNMYYEFFGKIPKDELKKIARNTMY